MQMQGNTILITGGGSGIGRSLAEKFHSLGNQVIISGRRQFLLEEVASANPGMRTAVLDISDSNSISGFAAQIIADNPMLNMIIHNAGIMWEESVLDEDVLKTVDMTIDTNLLGPIQLNTALLPHLLAQPQATVMTVSSGLAFVPKSSNPTYCATKAAIHSYTQSLRYQLQDTNVQVIEIVPPFVQTELQGPEQATNPHAMPLKDYINQTLDILSNDPDVKEVIIDRVKQQRFAEANGIYEEFYKEYNDRITGRNNI